MTTTSLRPIGQLNTKATVYCEICNVKHTRNLSELIYNKEDIDSVKAIIKAKSEKTYTCRICKSILKAD